MTALAANPFVWIQDACRQFSRAVGWELDFLPAGAGRGEDADSRLRGDSAACWLSEITDGQGRVGNLRLILPGDDRNDRSFPAVCELAETFARVISRCAAASRLAESRASELATLVDIGRSIPTED